MNSSEKIHIIKFLNSNLDKKKILSRLIIFDELDDELFWYISKDTMVEIMYNILNKGINFYIRIISDIIDDIERSMIHNIDIESIEDSYLDIKENFIKMSIIKNLEIGLISKSMEEIDNLDTSVRDSLINLLLK